MLSVQMNCFNEHYVFFFESYSMHSFGKLRYIFITDTWTLGTQCSCFSIIVTKLKITLGAACFYFASCLVVLPVVKLSLFTLVLLNE